MTKYTQKRVQKIVDLLATGEHRVEDICIACGISEAIFYKWKKERPEFAQLVRDADDKRVDAIGRLARSGLALLLDKHEYDEVITDYVDRGGKPKIKGRRVIRKTAMPSATAVIFALTNTDPDNWKHKNHTDLTTGGKTFLDLMQEVFQEGATGGPGATDELFYEPSTPQPPNHV